MVIFHSYVSLPEGMGLVNHVFMGFVNHVSWDFHGIFMGVSWDFTMKSGDLMGSNGI